MVGNRWQFTYLIIKELLDFKMDVIICVILKIDSWIDERYESNDKWTNYCFFFPCNKTLSCSSIQEKLLLCYFFHFPTWLPDYPSAASLPKTWFHSSSGHFPSQPKSGNPQSSSSALHGRPWGIRFRPCDRCWRWSDPWWCPSTWCWSCCSCRMSLADPPPWLKK